MIKNRKKLNLDELNINNIYNKEEIIIHKQNTRNKKRRRLFIYHIHLELKN